VLNSIFGEDLSSEFLFDDCMHVVAGAKSPWSRRRRINLAELSEEPWLMPESDNIAMALISEAFLSAGLTPPTPQVVSNSITLRTRLIETGQFIAILPDSSLRFGTGHPQIKILPIRLRLKAPPAVAISLKDRTPNPVARLFIDELRVCVKPLMNSRPRQT
jgi:DNA-binding transcriptional LysR family regulator